MGRVERMERLPKPTSTTTTTTTTTTKNPKTKSQSVFHCLPYVDDSLALATSSCCSFPQQGLFSEAVVITEGDHLLSEGPLHLGQL